MNDTLITSKIGEGNFLSNSPPQIYQSDLPQNVDLISSNELIISVIILIFGLISMIALGYFLSKGLLEKSSGTILFLVVFVVTAALFILTAGFSQEQMTPVMALLGTIVGYILGRNNNTKTNT